MTQSLLFGPAFFLLFAKIFQLAIGFLGIRLLTEILSKTEISFYFLVISSVSFFTFIFYNPIGQLISREASFLVKYSGLKTIIDFSLIYRCFVVVFAVVIYLFAYWLGMGVITDVSLLLPLSIGLFASTNAYLLSLANITIGRTFFSVCQVLSVIFSGFFAILGLFYFKTMLGWLLPLFIAQIVVSIFLYIRITEGNCYNKRIKNLISRPKVKSKIKRFVFPVAFILFLQWALIHSYKFFIGLTSGLEVLAVVGVLAALSSSLFAAIESLVNQFFISVFYKKISSLSSQDRVGLWVEYAHIIVPIYIMFAVMMAVNADLIFTIFLAEYYRGFFYLFLGLVFYELTRVLMNYIYLITQVEYVVDGLKKPYIFSSLLMLILLFSVGSLDGREWLFGIIMLFCGLILLIFSIFNTDRRFYLNLPFVLIFKTICCCLFIVFINFLFNGVGAVVDVFDGLIILFLNLFLLIFFSALLLYKDFRKLFSEGLF